MRNKKQFLGVLISVLICAFIVSLFVYATTTISEDVDIDTGNLVVGHDAILEHALQVGYTATVSYSRFSLTNTATGHSLTDNDDVLFVGLVEFDGTVFFDGAVSISDANGLDMSGGSTIYGDAASPSGTCTKGDVHINSLSTSGTGGNRVISVCDVVNEWTAIGE